VGSRPLSFGEGWGEVKKKHCLLSSFFETAVVYLLKHTSFMLKNKLYNVITVNAAIIIAIVIIIYSSTGGPA
jgi:hypothetical protein